MKLIDKRFWILIIPIITISCNNQSSKLDTETANTAQSIGNAIFCIQEISEEEYMHANSTANDYNIYPQRIDSIAKQDVLNKIFQDTQKRIAELDSKVIYSTTTCPCSIRTLHQAERMLRLSTSWRKWIVSMGISFSNLTIATMNEQLGMLIPGNLASSSNCVRLPIECGS